MSLCRVGWGRRTIPLPFQICVRDEKLWHLKEAYMPSPKEEKKGWCATITFAMEDSHTNALLFIDT
jgi:hypothetical protein